MFESAKPNDNRPQWPSIDKHPTMYPLHVMPKGVLSNRLPKALCDGGNVTESTAAQNKYVETAYLSPTNQSERSINLIIGCKLTFPSLDETEEEKLLMNK